MSSVNLTKLDKRPAPVLYHPPWIYLSYGMTKSCTPYRKIQ